MNEPSMIFDSHFATARTQQRLHHAYLLVGNTESVLADFVFRLLCPDAPHLDATEHCRVCQAVTRRVHPELFWADSTEKSLKIDTIREAIAFASLGAPKNQYRVIVLPGIERLMIPAANALLKTLEEPPRGVVFLLTAQSTRHLSVTLMSRCQKVRLPHVQHSDQDEIYSAFKQAFTQNATPFDVVGIIDELALPAETLIDCFMRWTVEGVKQCVLQHQRYDHQMAFYKKLLAKKADILKVSSLNASLLGYHLASEWSGMSSASCKPTLC